MAKDSSGFAYPQKPDVVERFEDGQLRQFVTSHQGMTKRELIAMHTMAGLMSAVDSNGIWMERSSQYDAAIIAVRYADALLAELAKE